MKKIIYFSFMIAVNMMMFSCSSDELSNESPTNSSNENNPSQYERLEFNSSKDLANAIAAGDENKTTNEVKTRGHSFISLLSTCAKTRADGATQTYYEALGYDSLVPNKAFAELLNPNGEVQCCDTIFKINQNGTYFFLKNKEVEFNKIYQTDSLGTLVSNRLYRLADGIFRYETFPKDVASEEIEEPDGLSDDSWNDGSYNSTRAFEDPMGYVPEFNADRHTWLGKQWQKLFGNDKYYDVKLSKNRRVRGRLYAYHYICYSEAGVTGMMQKKNWIGWSKTSADEIRIGWDNVVLSMKGHNPFSEVKLPTSMTLGGVRNAQINGKNVVYADLFIAKIDSKLIGSAVKASLKGLAKTLNGKQAGVVALATNDNIYLVILDDTRTDYDVKSITHVFNSNFNILFSVNLLNAPSSVLGWAKTLQGSLGQANYELDGGKAMIRGRLGKTWQGMNIVKYND